MMASRKFIGLLLVATLALMLPGGAWAIGTCTDSPTFCLNQWNVQLFEDNNDVVSVFVTGTTVEFIFHQGITPPTATDFQDLYFRSTAFDSVIASFTTTDGGGTAAYILQTGGGGARQCRWLRRVLLGHQAQWAGRR